MLLVFSFKLNFSLLYKVSKESFFDLPAIYLFFLAYFTPFVLMFIKKSCKENFYKAVNNH